MSQPTYLARRIGHWTVTALVGAVLAFVAIIVGALLTYSHVGVWGSDGKLTDLGAVRSLVIIGSALTLFWWRTKPLVPVVGGFVSVALAQFDYSVLFMGLLCWVALSQSKHRQLVTGLGILAIIQVTVRDSVRPLADSPGGTMWHELSPAGRMVLSALLALVSIGAIVAVELYRRARVSEAQSEARAVAETARSATLETELVRQGEREVLAREVHDALAHRLSLISMQSGSLEEAMASSDPQVAATAKALRQSAHASLDDLRSLLRSLRENHQGDPKVELPSPVIGLDALPDLIDDARASGVDVTPVIVIRAAESAPDAVGRATYRVVQEGLTNASKHGGPGPVQLEVRAAPDRGVRITIRNKLPAADAVPNTTGAQRGLLGISERASLAGGFASWRTEQDTFVLDVALPWSTEGASARGH